MYTLFQPIRAAKTKIFKTNPPFYYKTKMSVSELKTQLTTFCTSFDEMDQEVLLKLSEIFIQTFEVADGLDPTRGDLSLDLLMKFTGETSNNRTRAFNNIVKNVDHSSLDSFNRGRRGGPNCDIKFNSFYGFIQGALLGGGPNTKSISRFAAKCTALMTEMFVSKNRELQQLRSDKVELQTTNDIIDEQRKDLLEETDDLRVQNDDLTQGRDSALAFSSKHLNFPVWSVVLQRKGLSSVDRDTPSWNSMCALTRRLVRMGLVHWVETDTGKKKPYFICVGARTQAFPVIDQTNI